MKNRLRQHPEFANVWIDTFGVARPEWAIKHPLLQQYFDTEWGRPIYDEQGLFERLSLEGFQAGLSWLTALKKRPAFRSAFANFDPDIVSQFSENDIDELMKNAGIVRNAQKIRAVIHNAQATVALRSSGGLSQLIWSYQTTQPLALDSAGNPPTQTADSAALAKKLKHRGFRFVGATTVFAMLEAIGVVNTFPFRKPHNLPMYFRGD